jgi:hypothetical protein
MQKPAHLNPTLEGEPAWVLQHISQDRQVMDAAVIRIGKLAFQQDPETVIAALIFIENSAAFRTYCSGHRRVPISPN